MSSRIFRKEVITRVSNTPYSSRCLSADSLFDPCMYLLRMAVFHPRTKPQRPDLPEPLSPGIGAHLQQCQRNDGSGAEPQKMDADLINYVTVLGIAFAYYKAPPLYTAVPREAYKTFRHQPYRKCLTIAHSFLQHQTAAYPVPVRRNFMKHNYEERRQKRIDNAKRLAEKNKQKSDALREAGNKMANAIPFGQPILIGHHSEKSDRNYRKKTTTLLSVPMTTNRRPPITRKKHKPLPATPRFFG